MAKEKTKIEIKDDRGSTKFIEIRDNKGGRDIYEPGGIIRELISNGTGKQVAHIDTTGKTKSWDKRSETNRK